MNFTELLLKIADAEVLGHVEMLAIVAGELETRAERESSYAIRKEYQNAASQALKASKRAAAKRAHPERYQEFQTISVN